MSNTVLAPADLKTYLKNVENLEVMCYQQARLVQRLKQIPGATKKQIADLEKKNISLENSIDSEIDAQKTSSKFLNFFGVILGSLYWAVISALICGVIGFAIWLLCIIFGSHASLFPFLLWGAIIGFAFVFIGGIIGCVGAYADEVKAAPAKIDEYNKQKQEVSALIQRKQGSLKSSIPVAISEAENHYQQLLNSLNAYYEAGIIYPKYRGIVPITTIYEYIASGRCTALEGHEGAYNLYESELRMNLIIGKLDDISSKLDQIADNQRLLVQEIRESNQKIDELSKSVYSSLSKLDGIENNTELSAYYNRISASNTSYIAWLSFLNS